VYAGDWIVIDDDFEWDNEGKNMYESQVIYHKKVAIDAMKDRLVGPKHLQKTLEQAKNTWFRMHNEGRDALESLLGNKLPFQSKYDSVIAPALTCSFGACEYPGAVIFAEDVLQCNYKAFEYARTGTIIIHEMGHMWFGNIIPIHWWNDLYVKEAYADYVMLLAYNMLPCTRIIEGKRDFTDPPPYEMLWAQKKTAGLAEDLQPALSKALQRDFKFSCQQETMYTRITYGKSCAMLHELYNLLGGPNFFSDWANHYITTYKTKSTGTSELGNSILNAYKNSDCPKNHVGGGQLLSDKEV